MKKPHEDPACPCTGCNPQTVSCSETLLKVTAAACKHGYTWWCPHGKRTT